MTDVLPLSLFVCLLLWASNKYLKTSWLYNLRNSPQTFHKKSTSRLGGLAIYLPLLLVTFILENTPEYEFLRNVLLCSSPLFLVGILDDLSITIKPFVRILLMLPTPILLFFYVNLRVESVSIDLFDYLLDFEIFSLLFLLFSLIGIVNAFNIIDGFNGLLLSYCLTLMLSLLIGLSTSSTMDWMNYMVAVFFAVFAVFIINFPFGKIFLGDGGAYLLGLLIPVGLIKYTFDNGLSPWFVLTLLIYPVTEVIVSVIRKVFFRKMSALEPDGLHFHMLIYKKISNRVGFRRIRLRHFIVTFFIFMINFPFMIVANYFKNETGPLIFLCFWFITAYLLSYFILLPKYSFRKNK